MKSLTTIEQTNYATFIEMLRVIDPELYLIKISLEETGINASFIPKVIRAIWSITAGSGYGKIQIYMQAKVITNIKPEENVVINEDAVIDKD